MCRRPWVHAAILIALCAGAADAQPFIFYRGIVNAASYAPQGLPNGSIARGSIFAIFGRNFGPTQTARVSGFPLGTTLLGAGVSVCQSGTCIPAIPVFVSAGRINAIMPSNAPLGPVSLRVIFNGQGGYYASASVVASSFGIAAMNGGGMNLFDSYPSLLEDWRGAFAQSPLPAASAASGGGFGPGAIQNASPEGLAINSAVNPARPGQRVILWGTGLGAGLNSDIDAPEEGDLPVEVEIWVGGRKVTNKRYSGRSSCCAGIDRIDFDLPDDTPTGCYVPIQVRTDGQMVGNSVSIAVSSDGTACSDPSNPLSQLVREGGKLGVILANRVNAVLNFFDSQTEETVDFGLATFRRESGGPFAYNALLSLPPPGSCAVHAISGDFLAGAIIPGFRAPGVELDAGTTIAMGGVDLGKSAKGALYYTGTLGGTPAGFRKHNLADSVLGGLLAVRGTGGADVGPFDLELPATPPINWLNRLDGQTVDRSGGFTVTWDSTGASGNVIIAGVNSNVRANASALFLCAAVPGTSSFAVPPYIVQALPPSPDRAFIGHGFGYVLVGALPSDVPSISAPGLDRIVALVTSWSGSAVRFK